MRFIALLIEDYGDEWLWRPAMWWRWVPKASRVALGRRIATEMISEHLAIPIGFYMGRRQLNEWLWQDGKIIKIDLGTGKKTPFVLRE